MPGRLKKCGFCDADVRRIGVTVYDVSGAPEHVVPLYQCSECKSLIKAVSDEEVRSHIETTSYVRKDRECLFQQQRENFFEGILDVADRFLANSITRQHSPTASPNSILDVGCSYGHMLAMARKRGYETYGIEPTAAAADIQHSVILKSIYDIDRIPDQLDVVTMIDSLYYFRNPGEVVRRVADRLKNDGILIIRNTNRTWIYQFSKLLQKERTILGDAIYSYNLGRFRKIMADRYPFIFVESLMRCELMKREDRFRKALKKLGVNLGVPLVFKKVLPSECRKQ